MPINRGSAADAGEIFIPISVAVVNTRSIYSLGNTREYSRVLWGYPHEHIRSL